MLKTILAALDESKLAEQVIQIVTQLQLKPETKVVLSHVIPAMGDAPTVGADLPRHNAQELPYRHIEKQLQIYQAHLPCQSDLEIVSGDPAEEIIRLANIYQADLIVLGSRGLTGLDRIVQRSVSGQVVAEAPCSVLVVKPRSESEIDAGATS
ncbi:MAG: universal stress protein [Leptolyngbyaceae cyanobacterium MO_188.B28]|nr:universal stress protein [Leptolyngbyaceae cyanobacterium MO_188.B28]